MLPFSNTAQNAKGCNYHIKKNKIERSLFYRNHKGPGWIKNHSLLICSIYFNECFDLNKNKQKIITN